MEIEGKVVVVTGGASGIGRALARRFGADRAAGVVVADVDADGAAAVAADIAGSGGTAIAVPTNVGVEAEVIGLVERAEATYGPIDLFCSNAGIGGGAVPRPPTTTGSASGDVNTMAHVYAARALLPGWLPAATATSCSTASAAGLLTQIGSAPYAVTKHAAVAFAEWLSVTYGDAASRSRACARRACAPTCCATTTSASDGARRCRGQAGGAVLEPEDVADAVVQDDRRRRVPDPPPPRGARVLATQDRRLRPVAARDAAAAGARDRPRLGDQTRPTSFSGQMTPSTRPMIASVGTAPKFRLSIKRTDCPRGRRTTPGESRPVRSRVVSTSPNQGWSMGEPSMNSRPSSTLHAFEGQADHTLHERLGELWGGTGDLPGVDHHHIAARDVVQVIRDLVHEETIPLVERRLHRARLDRERLGDVCADQHRARDDREDEDNGRDDGEGSSQQAALGVGQRLGLVLLGHQLGRGRFGLDQLRLGIGRLVPVRACSTIWRATNSASRRRCVAI